MDINDLSIANLGEGNVKVSTIENESESAEARGGQGNNKLLSWDFGRTATVQIQDALLSDSSLAMLAGTTVKTEGITAVGRETLTLTTDAGGAKVSLSEEPTGAASVTAYKVVGSLMAEELTGFTLSDKDVKFATLPQGLAVGDQIMVFYEYEVTDENATQVTFSGNSFPATYRVVGDTIVRDESGVDHKMQFVIPKAKLQSGFSLTMDAENVSTFDFNLEVLAEAGTNRLYDIIRL